MVKIIIALVMLPILPVMYFMMRSDANFRKNIALGVTVPREAREDEEVTAIRSAYKKWLSIVTLIMLLLILPAFLIDYMSVAMMYCMTWLLVVMVTTFIPYGVCHKKLKALKANRGWGVPILGKAVVDLKSVDIKDNINPIWFLPAFLLTLIPVIVNAFSEKYISGIMATSMGASMVLMFYVFYHWLYRDKSEIIDDNTALTSALTRVRRRSFRKCWLFMSYATAVMAVLLWLAGYDQNAIMFVALGYAVIVMAAAMYVEFDLRGAQQRLSAKSGQGTYIDNDDYWLFGMFYNNPYDKHLIINSRVGMNSTVNIAKRSGKIIMIVSLLLILSLPFMGIWLMHEEFTPVDVNIEGNMLVATHTTKKYNVPLSDISSVTLLHELPPHTRDAGTAMDSVLKGNFTLQGIGKCKLSLNPNCPPFLVIEAHGITYVLGASDSEKAMSCYKTVAGTLTGGMALVHPQ